MWTVLFAIALIAQQPPAPGEQPGFSSPLEQLSAGARAESTQHSLQESERAEIANRERLFVQSFNQLATAIGDFSAKYRKSHTIDVRNVELIKKAYRNLERTDPWFKTQK